MNDKIFGAGLFGIDAFAAEVETYISEGLPKFDIVGLPDSAVRESRDRVRAALTNCGFSFPPSRITVNLAPADIKKSGVLYDLPILATVYKGNIIKNLIMDCQSYTKYRPNETTGGIFVSWRRKEELPTGA